MSGTSTAAGTGVVVKCFRNSWLCAVFRPGTSQCSIPCSGCVPASRRIMHSRQSSATAARAALDASTSEVGRIEQACQLFLRQIGHLRGDLADRLAFLVRLLRDRGALVVADDGVERGDEDRVAIERFRETALRSP